MRHPVTDIALLAYIARKNAKVVSYTEATKACKSSSSASRALHQLIREGLLEPKPKLLGLRYVTQYVVTQRGRQVAGLALQLTQLREAAAKTNSAQEMDTVGDEVEEKEKVKNVLVADNQRVSAKQSKKKPADRKRRTTEEMSPESAN